MNITIASGKGGTGKTTVAVNLAYVLASEGKKVRLLDCDVEEPNDHLFIQPHFSEQTPVNVMKPVIYPGKCTGCGICVEACTYNALALIKEKVLIFNDLCHACGLCSYICPEGAIKEKPYTIGTVEAACEDRNLPFTFAHGRLNIGEALAPVVVKTVKKYISPGDLNTINIINIIDASPGTSCPVVEAVQGADVAVLVTEPTPFGLNDLKLALHLCNKMSVPTGIIINRSNGKDAIITDYTDSAGVPIIGRIPFKREYAEAYSRGEILIHFFPELKNELHIIFDSIKDLVGAGIHPLPPMESVALKKGTYNKTSERSSAVKEICVISGKGGTGKTTLVSCLAFLMENKVLADNDVDAADLHLLLKPVTYEKHDFFGGMKYHIDADLCTGCGKCASACHFEAIYHNKIDSLACEGCGLCFHICPEKAITGEENITGQWYVSETDHGPLVHARLGIAEENSGKLVTRVRNKAAELTSAIGLDKILSDGPPGTGCPVIASVSGVDLVLIVTEPTVSGVHDLKRVLKLASHFNVPALVIINKADLNTDQAKKIEELSLQAGSRVIGKIPFDRNINTALMMNKTAIEYGKGEGLKAINHIWNKLSEEL